MEGPKRGCDLGICVSNALIKKTHYRTTITSGVLEASLAARACVQVLCVQKTWRFAMKVLKLSGHYSCDWSESVNVIGVISEPFAREFRE